MSSSSQSSIFKSTQFWLKFISEINANFITSCNRNIRNKRSAEVMETSSRMAQTKEEVCFSPSQQSEGFKYSRQYKRMFKKQNSKEKRN